MVEPTQDQAKVLASIAAITKKLDEDEAKIGAVTAGAKAEVIKRWVIEHKALLDIKKELVAAGLIKDFDLKKLEAEHKELEKFALEAQEKLAK
ncbi:hypothetical protein JOC36_000781 [Weissella uvarum]|uniref:hypothetical protein n=1 Tax=Weissella uvarum TaxID=1479233 RepID=UPI001960E7B8|nr:hypothetical protein [Weissella uvarum]MBM7617232.1 hypothetical protein [Weissella uvarum]MCM0595525.1 hypothetical protein [Weissella uvarum]